MLINFYSTEQSYSSFWLLNKPVFIEPGTVISYAFFFVNYLIFFGNYTGTGNIPGKTGHCKFLVLVILILNAWEKILLYDGAAEIIFSQIFAAKTSIALTTILSINWQKFFGSTLWMTGRIEQRNLKRRYPEEPKDLAFGGAWVAAMRG